MSLSANRSVKQLSILAESLGAVGVELYLVRCNARMIYFLRGMAIGVWLLIAVFAALTIFSSSHILLSVIASQVAVPRWLFVVALCLFYAVPAAVLLFIPLLMWKRKLPGLGLCYL